jgi:hypothetical protein
LGDGDEKKLDYEIGIESVDEILCSYCLLSPILEGLILISGILQHSKNSGISCAPEDYFHSVSKIFLVLMYCLIFLTDFVYAKMDDQSGFGELKAYVSTASTAPLDGYASENEIDTRLLVAIQNRKKGKSGGFQSMGLSSAVFKGVMRKGYKIPTPIQRKVCYFPSISTYYRLQTVYSTVFAFLFNEDHRRSQIFQGSP